ncbi:MAG: AAA family ATPase [Pseudomonadota bacterium]
MILKNIRKILALRTPLVYLVSEEEERVERLVQSATEQVFGREASIFIWSCIRGMTRGSEVVNPTTDLVEALGAYIKIKDPAPLIVKDLHLLVHGNAGLIRQLKDSARSLRTLRKTMFFVCPKLSLPDELFTVFKIEDVPLPRFDELSKILDMVVDGHQKAASLRASMSEDLKEKIIRAAMGFTGNEAWDAFRSALMYEQTVTVRCVDSVLEEKQALVEKSGVLEFVTTREGSWEIGGLANLKKWLHERDEAFSPEALRRGLPTPRGVLAMGISGCGKSLCIKAIATHWKLPLLRLDMGKLYDGLAGQPEEAMRKAIKTAEAVAPCVLWIDEIEAGIANQQQKAAGKAESRVLAIFLTWMQEKTAPVFVGATANEVEVLPPEVLRKGRFDELFFVGLPGKGERSNILKIHMERRKLDTSKYDMDYLADSTAGYNGAEIEQGVIAAIFESMAQGKELSEHALANCLRNIVPLSRTMKERIEKIEAWARDRAVKASIQTFDGRN